MDRSCMQPSYFLIQGSNSAVHPFEEEWADWDQSGRIIVSQEGRILAGKGIRRKTLHFEELADFNGDRPENIETPEWAKRW